MASGSGSNFQAIIDATENGTLQIRIAALIASKTGIGAIERAEKHGISAKVISPKDFESEEAFGRKLLDELHLLQTDLIVLAGYLIKIPPVVIAAFPNRILNIHPSLLPDFGGKGYYGMKVHRAVIEAKKKISGCTVHLVNEEFDKGPILAQSIVSVEESDTPESLAEKVLKQEHLLLPKTIQLFLNDTEL